jgi:hypothetical protein
MTLIAMAAYTSLILLILVEALLTQSILRDMLWLAEIVIRTGTLASPQWLRTGSTVPSFTARLLGSAAVIDRAALCGRRAILLFIAPGDAASGVYEHLDASVHALWHKALGNLYLVCRGNEDECLRLSKHYSAAAVNCHGVVPMARDADGTVARAFGIRETPHAVLIDEQCRISRNGRPLTRQEIALAG